MTVRELMIELRKFEPGLEVMTENYSELTSINSLYAQMKPTSSNNTDGQKLISHKDVVVISNYY